MTRYKLGGIKGEESQQGAGKLERDIQYDTS